MKTDLQDSALKVSGLSTEKMSLEARNKHLQNRKINLEGDILDKMQREVDELRKENKAMESRHRREIVMVDGDSVNERKIKTREIKLKDEEIRKLTQKISGLEKQLESKSSIHCKNTDMNQQLAEKEKIIKQIRKENSEIIQKSEVGNYDSKLKIVQLETENKS